MLGVSLYVTREAGMTPEHKASRYESANIDNRTMNTVGAIDEVWEPVKYHILMSNNDYDNMEIVDTTQNQLAPARVVLVVVAVIELTICVCVCYVTWQNLVDHRKCVK